MRKRAHVVQAVGELDDDHADVAAHGEEHLAEVPGLLGIHGGDLDRGELGHAVHEVRDRLPKELGDLVLGRRGVFHRVVEQGGADGVLVHAQVVSQDEGNLDGVVDVGLARAAALVLVEVGGKAIGAVDLLASLLIEVDLAGGLQQPEVSRLRHGLLGLCLRRRRRHGRHLRGLRVLLADQLALLVAAHESITPPPS